jgi:hypothetical protein
MRGSPEVRLNKYLKKCVKAKPEETLQETPTCELSQEFLQLWKMGALGYHRQPERTAGKAGG